MAEGGDRLRDLGLTLHTENIHIACLSEVGGNLNLSEVELDNFCCFKPDHSLYQPGGRGLLIYVHNSLVFSRRRDLETVKDACIWIEVKSRHKKLLVGLAYRSPSQSPTERNQFYKDLDSCIHRASAIKSDSIIVGGDFNARSKFWWDGDINTCEGTGLYDLSVRHSLSQFIHEPTRVTTTSKSCLDLIFSDSPGYVNDARVASPISLSDHSSTILSLDFYTVKASQSVRKRIWKFAETDVVAVLNAEVGNVNWEAILNIGNINTVTPTFTNTLLDIFSSHIPNHYKLVKSDDKPWFKAEIKRAINHGNKMYRKLRKPSEF
jgi:hypothetical protein